MEITVVGFNHKTAPIYVREKLAFDSAETLRALRQLKNQFLVAEFVLLSTCNRVELYFASERVGEVTVDDITKFFSEFHNIDVDDFKDFIYVHHDDDAVVHLLTVASSLDSMVLGEDQIVGQVKESFRLACTVKSTDKILNRLFHRAFTTSKKVHTSTSISNGRVSVAGVAVQLVRQLFADISLAKVVVIGAGEMGELLVQHLLHIKCRDITVVNRSYERGKEVAEKYGIAVQQWDKLNEQLTTASIVIASASAQDYLFNKDAVKKIMSSRGGKQLLIIDIAVPRNFDPAVEKIENVYLYSVDELSEVAEKNKEARKEDVKKGSRIVYDNVREFMDWFRAKDIGPLVGQMRQQFAKISQKELERFFVGIRQDASCRQQAESMVHRIVNRLLHCVIKNVDTVAKEHSATEAAMLLNDIVRQAEEISSQSNTNETTKS